MDPLKPERWPVTISFLADPDGYQVELVERHAEHVTTVSWVPLAPESLERVRTLWATLAGADTFPDAERVF